MNRKVLLVDDDPKILRLVGQILSEEGIESSTATTGEEALRRIREDEPTVLVLDLLLPDISGKAVLERIRSDHPRLPVVMLTARGDLEDVVQCMRMGAVDYVQKPFDRIRLFASINNARTQQVLRARVDQLADELHRTDGFSSILHRSAGIDRVVELLRRASKNDVTLLLEGESGTGKEIAARAVHAEGARRTGPFVAVNCGAIPSGLIESELFGHEKGAFTGATSSRPGFFEQAEGGTILLDEIGELQSDLQVRLLRVLAEKSVPRVGGARPRPVDVRVIAATNRDLKAEVARGGFREDLYYRLAVFPVRLPALRERPGDVLLLAEAFVKRFAGRHGKPIQGLTHEARQAVEAYAWPGNVRELENVIERATILEDGPAISLASLPDDVVCAHEASHPRLPEAATAAPAAPEPPLSADIVDFEEEERRIILRALELTRWNIHEAAARLRIGRATIYRKLERYGQLASRRRSPAAS